MTGWPVNSGSDTINGLVTGGNRTGDYAITKNSVALFPEMQLHLANGKTFTVLAPKVNKENIYIQSIKIDGKPYDKTYLTHEQIMSGATVEFEMSNTPKAIGVIFEDKNP